MNHINVSNYFLLETYEPNLSTYDFRVLSSLYDCTICHSYSFSASIDFVLFFLIDLACSPSFDGLKFAIERVKTIEKLCVKKKLGVRELNLIFIVSI
jgi:hypothetical protein